jgi:hypothetical protein
MKQDFPNGDKYSLAPWKPIAADDLIRLGREEDGGYVISRRCVVESRVLFAFGISIEWSFEKAFARANPKTTVIGVDGSVSARVFFSRAIESIKQAASALVGLNAVRVMRECRASAYWLKKAIQFRIFFDGDKRRFYNLFVGDIPKTGFVTWSELWPRVPLEIMPNNSLGAFVKMDIEGGEYHVLNDLIADASKINGMVVEFHDCDIYWEHFSTIMERLTNYFAIVHVHGNNFGPLIPGSATPRVLEISFVNRRLLGEYLHETTADYPRPSLDRPCNPAKPDYPIYF